MNKTAIYSTIIASTIAVLAVFAFGSSEVEAKPPSQEACPAENVQHWETWSFQYNAELTHLTNPTIPTNQLQVLKFKVDPTVPYWSKAKIVDRLNELGYTDSVTGGIPNTSNLGNNFFESSTTICAQN